MRSDQRESSRRQIHVPEVTIVLIGVMAILVVLISNVASQEGIYVEDEYLNLYELDPIAVALGVTTSAEARAFYARQASAEQSLLAAAGKHPELRELSDGTRTVDDLPSDARTAVDDSALQMVVAYNALESAADGLYDDLSKTDKALVLSDQWSRCMKRSGFNYQSPVEVETDIERHSRYQTFDNLSDLLDSRDKCLAEVETATERLALELLPEWKNEHASLISAYKDALDLSTTR